MNLASSTRLLDQVHRCCDKDFHLPKFFDYPTNFLDIRNIDSLDQVSTSIFLLYNQNIQTKNEKPPGSIIWSIVIKGQNIDTSIGND